MNFYKTPFTIEFYIFWLGTFYDTYDGSNCPLISRWSHGLGTSYELGINKNHLFLLNSNLDYVFHINEVIPSNKWIHICLELTKDGTSKLFINGKLKGEATFYDYSECDNFTIGNSGPNSKFTARFQGYISDFRVSNIARYNSDFDPFIDTYKIYNENKYIYAQS